MFEQIKNLTFIPDDFRKYVPYIIVFGVFIIGWIFKYNVSKGILNLILGALYKSDNEKKQVVKKAMVKPLSFLLLTLLTFGVTVIYFNAVGIVKAFKIAIILMVCWCFTSYLSTGVSSIFRFTKNNDDQLNTTAIKFINNIVKILIVIFAVVMILSELGYNINGLITGIGVGGLAISLAAQEAISNLISGFIIIFEKPFKVGDLIQTPSIHGFVEEVKMRSTTIRMLDDSLVTIPNSSLTKEALTNISAMDKRRIEINFGLIYNTSNETIEKCKKDIIDYCKNSKDIMAEPLRVHFKYFGDSSIDFQVVCYTVTGDLDEYLNILENVNLEIKKIIELNDTEFAFPTTSVYLENK